MLVFLPFSADNRVDIQCFHNAVNMVLAVVFVVELIDVKCHPAVTKNVIKSVIVLPNQLGKKIVLLLRFRNLSVQPLVIGCSGNTQLMAHPANAQPLFS